MHEVTGVFLGVIFVLSNEMVYSRFGIACVAMVTDRSLFLVLKCYEVYKFLRDFNWILFSQMNWVKQLPLKNSSTRI